MRITLDSEVLLDIITCKDAYPLSGAELVMLSEIEVPILGRKVIFRLCGPIETLQELYPIFSFLSDYGIEVRMLYL